MPRPNSHDMARFCQTIMNALWDDNIARQKFVEAADLITQKAENNLHRDNIRTEPFTELITTAARQHLSDGATS